MQYLIIGVILGVITYISWMGYYWLYLPRKIRLWFERSTRRLFILDITLTVVGMIGFSAVSNSLTALIAASTLGLLGTFTTIGIRSYHHITSIFKNRQ
jgi:hypothetical protein